MDCNVIENKISFYQVNMKSHKYDRKNNPTNNELILGVTMPHPLTSVELSASSLKIFGEFSLFVLSVVCMKKIKKTLIVFY